MFEIFSQFKGEKRSLRTEGWKRETLLFFLPVTLKVEEQEAKFPPVSSALRKKSVTVII